MKGRVIRQETAQVQSLSMVLIERILPRKQELHKIVYFLYCWLFKTILLSKILTFIHYIIYKYYFIVK